MSEFTFKIDGVEIAARAGQTIMDAADEAGIYVPRLCDHEGLRQGGCRVCTVKANGRSVSACTQPAEPDLKVENETPHINKLRRDLVEMLFHEGNHLCPICEASGNCELQAMAYRLDMTAPTKFPYLEPCRPVDASHPEPLHLVRTVHPRVAGCRWKGRLWLRGSRHPPPRGCEWPRPRAY